MSSSLSLSPSLSPAPAWGLEVTLTLVTWPTTLAAWKGLSEAPRDLGDVVGAGGSTSSRSGPTSAAPTGLPELCSSTTCLTADFILINGPIV